LFDPIYVHLSRKNTLTQEKTEQPHVSKLEKPKEVSNVKTLAAKELTRTEEIDRIFSDRFFA
jgi:hypothetical protein